MFFYLIICVVCFLLKKNSYVVDWHDLHHNYGLHFIDAFNLFEYCILLEILIFDSCVRLERFNLFD
jgi:hypothetical protein